MNPVYVTGFGLAITFVLALSACSEESGPLNNKTPFECPARPGDELRYDIRANFGGGVQRYEDAVSVHWAEDLGNCTFRVLTSIPQFGIYQSEIYRDSEEGTYLLSGASELLLFPRTMQVGDVYISVLGADTTWREVVADNLSVTVPAGTFSCSKLITTTTADPDYVVTDFLSNGLIAREQQSSSMPFMRIELRQGLD